MPQPEPHETATRILTEAERLFAEQGFDRVSMTVIAAAAEVSKANIFHHFSSKETLYLAVLKRACGDASQMLSAVEALDGGSAEQIRQLSRSHIQLVHGHDQASRLALREMIEHGERSGRAFAEEIYGENFHRTVALLHDGQQRGELRPGFDPALAATLLVGANVFHFIVSAMLRHLPEVDFADDPERFSQGVVDILLNGMNSQK